MRFVVFVPRGRFSAIAVRFDHFAKRYPNARKEFPGTLVMAFEGLPSMLADVLATLPKPTPVERAELTPDEWTSGYYDDGTV